MTLQNRGMLHSWLFGGSDGRLFWDAAGEKPRVSWPNQASGVVTDVTEDTIRQVAVPKGLMDVKVCAVDEVWSGLKLVIRKELRRP